MQYRTETDSMGDVKVPADAYYGASTQRAVDNFPISDLRFNRRFIWALGLIKGSVATVAAERGDKDAEASDATRRAADEVMEGALDAQFVLDIFQTGSGTSTNTNANEVIAARASELLDGELAPVLFHCTTGKDRTGWTAATFLSLMGVDREDVYREYLLTNDRLVPSLKPIFDRFAAAGGDPDLLLPFLGVDETYLDAAFTEMEKNHGTLEHYFTEALGVDLAAQEALRERYLLAPA